MKRQKSILGIAISILLMIMMNTLPSFGAEFPFTDVFTDTWYYHDVKEGRV